MQASEIKLSYIGAQFKIRVTGTVAAFKSEPIDPALIQRARKKLDSLKVAGDIAFYKIYDKDFKQFWTQVQNCENISATHEFHFVLGQGCPDLSEYVQVTKSDNEKAAAKISITSDASIVRKWRFDWLLFFIEEKLSSLEPNTRVHPAQLNNMFIRAAYGFSIKKHPIARFPLKLSDAEIDKKPYILSANKSRSELILTIHNPSKIATPRGKDKVIQAVQDAIKKINSDGISNFSIRDKEIDTAFDSVNHGQEYFQINTPLAVLAANSIPKATENQESIPNYPGAGSLQFEISEDKMEAKISNFDMNIYNQHEFKIDSEFLMKECTRAKLNQNLAKPHLRKILNSVSTAHDLSGLVICTGEPSRPGQRPYIHPVYKELQKQQKAQKVDENPDAKVNMRENAAQNQIQTGELIAEIRYKTPPYRGKNVLGEKLPPAPNPPGKFKVGQGVEEEQEGKFIAQIEGVPFIERDEISVRRTMKHQGDVNLKTGNIDFEGPVEINGSIELGATVRVGGNLLVKGSIRGGVVLVAGDLTVRQGIVTGEKGFVNSAGNLNAQFIENSNVTCAGSITVYKAILNSHVISGGSIYIEDKKEGVVGGGVISARYNLFTGQLGFNRGNPTKINLGVDWKIEKAVMTRENRIAKLTEQQNLDRQALRDVMQRKKEAMTAKFEEKKQYYQDRLVKIRAIIEKVKEHLDNAKRQMVFDPTVRVFVTETCFSSCEVYIGGNQVLITQNIAGVALLGKKVNGSTIVPIEDGVSAKKKEDEKKALDEDMNEDAYDDE